MAQADSKNSITASADTKSRRAFLIVAAVGSVAGAGSLAFAAAAPNDVPKAVTVPPSPAIAGHDPVFGLIADKRAADIAMAKQSMPRMRLTADMASIPMKRQKRMIVA